MHSAAADAASTAFDSPLLAQHLRSAVRDVLTNEYNITKNSNNVNKEKDKSKDVPRRKRQLDRTDALLAGGYSGYEAAGNSGRDFPLHEPSGEKTRKTFDFTSE